MLTMATDMAPDVIIGGHLLFSYVVNNSVVDVAVFGATG